LASIYEEYFFDKETDIVEKPIGNYRAFIMPGILRGRSVRVNMPLVATVTSREVRVVKAFFQVRSTSIWTVL
jgi:hypothetical protein